MMLVGRRRAFNKKRTEDEIAGEKPVRHRQRTGRSSLTSISPRQGRTGGNI